jgi:OOP family OmpA-OmpF porin
MKNKLFIALLAAAAVAPIAAQAQNTYVGANIGRAEQKLSGFGSSVKDSDTGYKVYAGYQFDATFGIEGGYVNLGEATLVDPTGSASAKPSSVYVAATGTLPVADQFAVFAKVGVSANRTKVRGTYEGVTETETFNKTAAILGVGASYALAKNVSLVVEYENFGKLVDEDGINLKADQFSVGLRYKF